MPYNYDRLDNRLRKEAKRLLGMARMLRDLAEINTGSEDGYRPPQNQLRGKNEMETPSIKERRRA